MVWAHHTAPSREPQRGAEGKCTGSIPKSNKSNHGPLDRDGRQETNNQKPTLEHQVKTMWNAMQKARVQARRSDLETDREIFRAMRKPFQKENRNERRRLEMDTEAKLRNGGNGVLADAIRKDTRREQREREQSAKGDPLNPSDFRRFMGTHPDLRQEKIILQPFTAAENFTSEIIRTIKWMENKKAPGRDGVHNEMLNIEPALTAELLAAVWHIIGRPR